MYNFYKQPKAYSPHAFKGNIQDGNSFSARPEKYYTLPDNYYGMQYKRNNRPQPKKKTPPRPPPEPTPPREPTPKPPTPQRTPVPTPQPTPKIETPKPQKPPTPRPDPTPAPPTPKEQPFTSIFPPITPPQPDNPMTSTPDPGAHEQRYQYQPLYKPRPEPMFPPILPVAAESWLADVESFDASRNYCSIVPGYNAVGSILRSMRIHGP